METSDNLVSQDIIEEHKDINLSVGVKVLEALEEYLKDSVQIHVDIHAQD